MKKIIITLLIIFLLTGCYNYRELNDLAIVTAISIEKDNNEYKIITEVINPKKESDTSKSNEPDFITFTETAPSLKEAFRLIIKESPKKVYGAHMQILIIDESLAKEGIEKILDFFFREPEVRKEFYVLVGKNKDILDVLTPLDNVSSKNILDSLTSTNNYLGLSSLVTYNDLMNNYLNSNIEISLPSIEIIGNQNESTTENSLETTTTNNNVIISNMAIFKDNILLGYLSQEESIAYNFIKDNITNTIITSNYIDGYVVNELIDTKTSIEANPKDNKITINIKGKSSISEVTTKDNLNKESTIKKFQKQLNKDIKKLIKNSISSINKKYNSDIYGFKDLYYKTDPKYYKKIKDKWYEEIFNNINIEVKSNITITEKGNLLGGIYE